MADRYHVYRPSIECMDFSLLFGKWEKETALCHESEKINQKGVSAQQRRRMRASSIAEEFEVQFL